MLNFEAIKNEKTIVGGLQGEYKVKLVGFDTKADSKGNTNYQFTFGLVEYPGVTRKVNTSIQSMYKSIVSQIGIQLGFEEHIQQSDVEVLTKATKEVFSIWINGTYTNFKEYVPAETEEAISEAMI